MSLLELGRPHGQCFSKKGCGVLGAWSDVDLDNGCNDIISSIPLSFVDGSRKRYCPHELQSLDIAYYLMQDHTYKQ